MRIIYLSGLYTTGDINENIANARRVAIELWEKSYTVLCPHLNTAHFEVDCKCVYDDYIRGDLELLSRCDAIVMLPGWELSKGAKIEKTQAQKWDMPIYYYPDLPVLRPRMTDQQEAHLQGIINKFSRDVSAKYSAGQAEHGGNLFDKPNLPMLMQEVQDMVVYAYTLKDQIREALELAVDDKETINILTTGNAQGKEYSD